MSTNQAVILIPIAVLSLVNICMLIGAGWAYRRGRLRRAPSAIFPFWAVGVPGLLGLPGSKDSGWSGGTATLAGLAVAIIPWVVAMMGLQKLQVMADRATPEARSEA